MAWNTATNQFDLADRPAFNWVPPGAVWTLHHRIPWALLCRVLNEIVGGRRDPYTLNLLLGFSSASTEPMITGFRTAATLVRSGHRLEAGHVAALDSVEQEVFSLPCNLFWGPSNRPDDPGTGMDFTGADIDGDGLIRDTLSGRLQRIRERAMSALIRNDTQALQQAKTEWIGLWIAPPPDGFGLTRSTTAPFDATLWEPDGTPTYRKILNKFGFQLTALQSRALNDVVERRVETKYAAVFQVVEAPRPAPPAPPEPGRTIRQIQRYGWRPDLPDHRDHMFTLGFEQAITLPPSVDLRPRCPPVYDQGALGSCTGNAIAAAIQYDRQKQDLVPDFVPSRLFIYYNERVIEDSIPLDAGAQIRDGIKCVAAAGVCTEDDWPYEIGQFAVRPPDGAFGNALGNKALSYQRLDQSLTEMKTCLAAGFPFVFGFTVYQSFESEAVRTSGIVPMPSASDKMIGGHAVLAVGYDDAEDMILVRNSWGPGWGLGGYFKLPYAYIQNDNLAADFWKISLVGATGPLTVAEAPDLAVVIVIGDGELGPDYDHQAEEFVFDGIELAKHFSGAAVHIYVLKSRRSIIESLTEKDISKSTIVNYYTDSSDLLTNLGAYANKKPFLIVIGHGTDGTTLGSVTLCWEGGPSQRTLTAAGINAVHPIVYVGLHCYSGRFTAGLTGDIFWVALTGADKGTNAAISIFIEKFGTSYGASTLLDLVAACAEGEDEIGHAANVEAKFKDILRAAGNTAATLSPVANLVNGLRRGS